MQGKESLSNRKLFVGTEGNLRASREKKSAFTTPKSIPAEGGEGRTIKQRWTDGGEEKKKKYNNVGKTFSSAQESEKKEGKTRRKEGDLRVGEKGKSLSKGRNTP